MVEIWKRFRKWGGIPTGITQNCKDLLASPEISNIFENSDFILMLNQASGDRESTIAEDTSSTGVSATSVGITESSTTSTVSEVEESNG